jgi:hypothetical protein
MKILAAESMKPNELKRHFVIGHAYCVGIAPEFSHRKLKEFNKQEQTFIKILHQYHFLKHSKLLTELPNCKKPHRFDKVS